MCSLTLADFPRLQPRQNCGKMISEARLGVGLLPTQDHADR